VEIQIAVIVFSQLFFVVMTVVQFSCHTMNHTCTSTTTIDVSTSFGYSVLYSVFSHNCFSCTVSLLSKSLYLYKSAKYFNCMLGHYFFSTA
jgi:hypothetical protein